MQPIDQVPRTPGYTLDTSDYKQKYLWSPLCLLVFVLVSSPCSVRTKKLPARETKAKPFNFSMKIDDKTRYSRPWRYKPVSQHPGDRGCIWSLRSAWAVCESLSQKQTNKPNKIKNKQKSVIIPTSEENQVGSRRDCMKGTHIYATSRS